MMIHLLADGTSPTMWHDMFALALPIAEKMLRPIFVYVFLIIGLRLAGKRELAQLNPFDLIVLLTLSNTVQNAIIGDDLTITGGVIGASTLLAVNYFVVRIVHRSKTLQHLVEGRRDVLVKNGHIRGDHLDRELITRADLKAAALKQGISSLKDVEECILEPTGAISFVEKKPTQDMKQHDEIMSALELLRSELAVLRAGNPAAARAADAAIDKAENTAAKT
jgi:uncharacterized membrane protein YcaP (DUF421 family)